MRCLPHRTDAIKITPNSVPQFMLRRNRAAQARDRPIAALGAPKEYRRYPQFRHCLTLTLVPARVILLS
jgi:hypothetical protein